MPEIIGLAVMAFMMYNLGGDQRIDHIDPAFEPFIEMFEYDYNRYTGKKLEMPTIYVRFGTLDNATLGTCQWPDRVITIDPAAWRRSSNLQRQWLIYHELGHCAIVTGKRL